MYMNTNLKEAMLLNGSAPSCYALGTGTVRVVSDSSRALPQITANSVSS